ncbi:hypothetical protein ACOSP7_016123 [Xanthoceras sorbifolium]
MKILTLESWSAATIARSDGWQLLGFDPGRWKWEDSALATGSGGLAVSSCWHIHCSSSLLCQPSFHLAFDIWLKQSLAFRVSGQQATILWFLARFFTTNCKTLVACRI